MDYAEARTLRDFLLLYNKISEDCFRKCVFNMTQRTLDDEEVPCISTCVQKHVNVNHKIMQLFAEINPPFQQRKLEEAEAQQKQLLNEQKKLEEAQQSQQQQLQPPAQN